MNTEIVTLKGYSNEPEFYVYVHKRPDGSVFYVGKGKGNRAWTKKSRNLHWQHVVDKYGTYDVEILKDNLTEQDAFALEVKTINEIGLALLTNQTLGGISTTGMTHSDETRKIQSEIAKQRLKEDPERLAMLTERIVNLCASQTDEFRLRAISAANETTRNYSQEEKDKYVKRKTAWLADPEKRKAVFEKQRLTREKPEVKAKISLAMRNHYSSLPDEEKLRLSAIKTSYLGRRLLAILEILLQKVHQIGLVSVAD